MNQTYTSEVEYLPRTIIYNIFSAIWNTIDSSELSLLSSHFANISRMFTLAYNIYHYLQSVFCKSQRKLANAADKLRFISLFNIGNLLIGACIRHGSCPRALLPVNLLLMSTPRKPRATIFKFAFKYSECTLFEVRSKAFEL